MPKTPCYISRPDANGVLRRVDTITRKRRRDFDTYVARDYRTHVIALSGTLWQVADACKDDNNLQPFVELHNGILRGLNKRETRRYWRLLGVADDE